MLTSLSDIIAHFRASGKHNLVIYGPTASGKSDLAVKLAKEIGGGIINSDARQIYAGMAIGTGAVTHDEMQGVPHYLLQDHDPALGYDAMRFREEALQCAQKLSTQNLTPIFVGGTGLYIESLLGLLSEAIPTDPLVRAALERECEEKGLSELVQRLYEVDPVSASRLDPLNARYIIRALEIWQTTGKPKSAFESSATPSTDFMVYGLVWERGELIGRIDARHAAMFENGFLDEVRALCEREVQEEVWKTIGYLEARSVLDGTLSLSEAISRTQAAARQYAKRQMTWLRRMQSRHPVTLLDGKSLHQNASV